MESPVGTDHDAELFAEVGKAKVEGGSEEGHDAEGGQVVERAFADEAVESFERDKVGKKDVGKKGRNDHEEAVFEEASPDFRKSPRGRVQSFASGGIALDEAFDAAEDVFEEDGVRTGPAAPESPEEGGDEEEGKAGPADRKKEDPEILWVKGEAEEVKFALGDIEKDGGRVVDGDPGKGHVDDEKEKSKDPAEQGEAAGDVSGVENVVGPVGIHRGHTIEIGVFSGAHDLEDSTKRGIWLRTNCQKLRGSGKMPLADGGPLPIFPA